MQFFFPFTLPADQEQVYQVAKQQAERAGRTKMSEGASTLLATGKMDGNMSRPLDDKTRSPVRQCWRYSKQNTTLDCFGYLSEMIGTAVMKSGAWRTPSPRAPRRNSTQTYPTKPRS